MKKIKNLTEKEQKEVNGGGLLGGNDSHNEGGLSGSLGIGNLLSAESSSTDGDESQSSSFSVGNGINLDGVGIGRSMKS